MKRLVAKRKLKRNCLYCGHKFFKGDIYYKHREVSPFDYEYSGIIAVEYLICPRCKYKEEQHNKRFEEFKKHCTHLDKFRDTKYGYIPGECVMQPEYDYCVLCGKKL